MEKLMNGIYTLAMKMQPLIAPVIIIVLILIGFMLLAGEKSKTKAKEWAPWVILGCGLVLGAVEIGKEIASAFVF